MRVGRNVTKTSTYEYPVCVEPGKDEGGEEGDEDEYHVGQVELGVVLVRLWHRMTHHPTQGRHTK